MMNAEKSHCVPLIEETIAYSPRNDQNSFRLVYLREHFTIDSENTKSVLSSNVIHE